VVLDELHYDHRRMDTVAGCGAGLHRLLRGHRHGLPGDRHDAQSAPEGDVARQVHRDAAADRESGPVCPRTPGLSSHMHSPRHERTPSPP